MTQSVGFWKKIVAVGVVMSMTFGGGIAFASHSFNDVPDGNIFHDQIDFLASRNITLGCGSGNFCPNDSVTRQEMAAFLERMARALSPVVLSTSDFVTEGTPACVLGPHTPEFEQVATFTGGLYGFNGDVYSRVKFRVNGGTWFDVNEAWYLPDTAESDGYGSSPLVGSLPLAPGIVYEFSIDNAAIGDGTDSGCSLTAIIHHQMPEAAAGPAPQAGAPAAGSSLIN